MSGKGFFQGLATGILTKRVIFLFFFTLLFLNLPAQKPSGKSKTHKRESDPTRQNFVTLGIEPSLLFPTALFNSSSLKAENPNFRRLFSLGPRISWRAGLSIRYDLFRLKRSPLSNQFSVTSGLYYTQRHWTARVDGRNEAGDNISVGESRLRFISYEIPLMLLLNLRAGDILWLGTGTGLGVEFFPSQAYVPDEAATVVPQDGYWLCYMARKNLFVPAFKMQFGAEWRTEKAGYFYVGFSFHQPLPRMGDAFWRTNVGSDAVHPFPDEAHPAGNPDVPMRVSGGWLALDLRYFFKPSRAGRADQILY